MTNPTSVALDVRSGLLTAAVVAAIVLIFVDAPWLTLAATALLSLYLILGWRRFSVGTWVPILMSFGVLAIAILRDVPSETLMEAAGRSLFLASLISLLGMLRSAAMLAPEVETAGTYLTSQPASRRYLALTFGGHLFGVLINFGGLVILLDLAKRAVSGTSSMHLPQDLRDVKLRRMTLAIVRGFSLISLWSPFGFAMNVVLITLPSLSYFDIGPAGFAISFVFIAIGWTLDRLQNRQLRSMSLTRSAPVAGGLGSAALLFGHVLALGAGIFALHEVAPLSFQQSLVILVPCYALFWSASSSRKSDGGPLRSMSAMLLDSWRRSPVSAGEVGVFAAAGFLSIALVAIIPVEGLRGIIANLSLGPVTLVFFLMAAIIASAFVGINPIVSSSVFGAIAVQLALPGLGELAIAFAIVAGWTSVIGLSPLITTIILCASIVGKPAHVIGLIWNGPYCAVVIAFWVILLSTLMWTGVI